MKNILLISNVNKNSPAVRYRLIYTLDRLVEEGKIKYDFIHFYSDKTLKAMDGKNQLSKLMNVLLDFVKFLFIVLAKNKKYNFLIVKNYIFPFGGSFSERLVLCFIKHDIILYDIDDAIYLNNTRPQNKIFSKFRNASKKVRFWTNKANKVFASNGIIVNDIKMLYNVNEEKFINLLSAPFENQYFENLEQIEHFKDLSKITFIWLGSPHTQKNLAMCVEFVRSIPKIIANAEVIIIGCTNDYNPFSDLNYVKLIEWSEEVELKYMREAHFGLNPLYNDEFERRKSAFKVIQYYRAGVIPIVSNVGINSNLIKAFGGYCTESFQMDEPMKEFIDDSLLAFKDRVSEMYSKSTILSVESNKEIVENAIFSKNTKQNGNSYSNSL